MLFAFLSNAALAVPQIVCSNSLPEDPSRALGVAPVELRCSVSHPDLEAVEALVLDWGDGTPLQTRFEGLDQVSHVYDERGRYRVRACFRHPDGESCATSRAELTVCDVPEVSFEVEDLGSHTVRLINHTPIDLPGCVSEARWSVYAGNEVAGEPVVVRTAWEPVIELDEAGPYTLVLDVGGIAGTGAASATVDVGRSGGCDVSRAGLLGLFVVPLALARRRRSSVL